MFLLYSEREAEDPAKSHDPPKLRTELLRGLRAYRIAGHPLTRMEEDPDKRAPHGSGTQCEGQRRIRWRLGRPGEKVGLAGGIRPIWPVREFFSLFSVSVFYFLQV
jgi:hypothetical protein